MTKPGVVIFDLGKVLLDFDYRQAAGRIAERSKLTPEQVMNTVAASPLLLRYETGLLDSRSFFDAICEATGFCGTYAEFAPAFGNIFEPIQPMVNFQLSLKQAGIPTYIFSNTNDLAVAYIRQHFPFFNGFTGYFLSYELGVMKPEAAIYEIVEQITGRKGQDLLYIDDRPENTEAGAARQWQVITHTSPADTIKQAAALGLPIEP